MNEKTQPCTHCGAVHPRVNLTWMGSAELCPECLQRYFRALLAGDFALLPANRKPDQPLGCYKDCGEEILKEAKHGANGRYACINLTNTDTIEFRVFRGTLKYNTVIATLQFVANLCRVAISLPEYRIQEFSWPALIEALTQDNCPELVQYLKERNLYVNEPVTAEREV